MELAFKITLFVHLTAFAVGAVSAIVMPLIGGQMAALPPEQGAPLRQIAMRMSINARVALAALVISGVVMLQLRYNGDAFGLGPWFIAKLSLVAAIIAVTLLNVFARQHLNQKLMSMISRFLFLAIVVCAVATFA